MKIFLIIDETHFYQPNFVADFLQNVKHEVVGGALVTKVLPKSNIELYMKRNFFVLKWKELLKLGLKKIEFQWKNWIRGNDPKGDFYSVKKVYDSFGVDYFEVEYDINKREYIQKIKEKRPDVILSSNSMIFGNEILNIPKYCINRHSALLPSYGGLWPVFQAVRSGENEVGVSVHTMEQSIDKGVLLAQTFVSVEKGDTIDLLYQKCFSRSADTVLKALDRIEKNDVIPLDNNFSPSYFSFPTKQHWKEFREKKIPFI